MREGTQTLSTSLGTSIGTRAYTSWHPATQLLNCYQRAVSSMRLSQVGIILIFIVVIVDLLTQSSRQKTFCSSSRKTFAKQERHREQGNTSFCVQDRLFKEGCCKEVRIKNSALYTLSNPLIPPYQYAPECKILIFPEKTIFPIFGSISSINFNNCQQQ